MMMLKAIGLIGAIFAPLLLSLIARGQRDDVPGNTNVFMVFGLVLVVGVVSGVLIGEWWALMIIPTVFVLASALWRPVMCADCSSLTYDGLAGPILSAIVTGALVAIGVGFGLVIRTTRDQPGS